MQALEFEDLLERELLVYVAGTVPDDHVVASGEFLYVGSEVAVRGEDNGLLAGDRLDDLEGV